MNYNPLLSIPPISSVLNSCFELELGKRTSPSGFVLGLSPVRSASSLISCHTGFSFPN